ncbi:MAG: right-handed parallel beta-helix repeat-containing protein, partial [Acidobacteriaceae bacterium]
MLFRWCLVPLFFLRAALPAGGTQMPPGSEAGHHFFLDCGAGRNGDGLSPQSAWNAVGALNAASYHPGDVVAIRRGTTCHGSLAPTGSGVEGAPIRLTAYGEGPRPQVVADPDAAQALRLFNQQYWDIDSLDLAGGRTNGVFISGDNGVLHHIHLANLTVHGVMGGAMKHKESGLVAVSPVKAECHFDDVLIDNVVAWDTNQWVGILVGGGNLGYPPKSEWSSNVTIRNSVVHNVQGDGIVLFRVRHGLIESSIAWDTGMQPTESIGTPNAIWTWMCDDCTVQDSEAFLTDSPGVDGGAYDIDYGNTKNSVIDNYGHDTQGYCVAVFGAGFVTHQSLVRGNLCINHGRSPRMAKNEGAIYIYTWNGGSIDGLTVVHNTVEWSPFNNAPPILNKADLTGSAVFRNNSVASAARWMVDSNASLSFEHNQYRYYGIGDPAWRYGNRS